MKYRVNLIFIYRGLRELGICKNQGKLILYTSQSGAEIYLAYFGIEAKLR